MTDILKLSAPEWCFLKNNMPADKFYQKLKAAGYAAAEMVTPDNYQAARNAGLEILNLGAPGMQKGINNPDNHQELIPQIIAAINNAADNSIPQVIIFSGNCTDHPQGGINASACAIEKLLPVAQKQGVILTFEILNSFDHPGYEGCLSDYGFSLIEKFDSPQLKVLLDIYHVQRMGEAPVAIINKHSKNISHIHIAGCPKRNFPSSEQKINYQDCLKALKKSGYHGYLGMEFMPESDALTELNDAANLFNGYMNRN